MKVFSCKQFWGLSVLLRWKRRSWPSRPMRGGRVLVLGILLGGHPDFPSVAPFSTAPSPSWKRPRPSGTVAPLQCFLYAGALLPGGGEMPWAARVQSWPFRPLKAALQSAFPPRVSPKGLDYIARHPQPAVHSHVRKARPPGSRVGGNSHDTGRLTRKERLTPKCGRRTRKGAKQGQALPVARPPGRLRLPKEARCGMTCLALLFLASRTSWATGTDATSPSSAEAGFYLTGDSAETGRRVLRVTCECTRRGGRGAERRARLHAEMRVKQVRGRAAQDRRGGAMPSAAAAAAAAGSVRRAAASRASARAREAQGYE